MCTNLYKIPRLDLILSVKPHPELLAQIVFILV